MRVSIPAILLVLLTTFTAAAAPQGNGPKRSFRASDGASIDAIVSALYESVSATAGEEKDWSRLRGLFAPGARLMPVVWDGGDRFSLRTLSVEDYIRHATSYFRAHSFYEREIVRRVDRFGSMAQVFSTYEAFDSRDTPVPVKRGINSIQMHHDGERWWIVSVLWDEERSGSPIPQEYLLPRE